MRGWATSVKERVVEVARSWESSSWGGPRTGQCRETTRWACQSGALRKSGAAGAATKKCEGKRRAGRHAGHVRRLQIGERAVKGLQQGCADGTGRAQGVARGSTYL